VIFLKCFSEIVFPTVVGALTKPQRFCCGGQMYDGFLSPQGRAEDY